jgi:uncharacterized protein (TIGR02266 family)
MPRNDDPAVRRRFRRRTVRILVDYQASGPPACEYATTLGAGGMFIESEEALPPGTVLKVRFRLPEAEALHDIEARVAWCLSSDEAGLVPGMGIEFTDAVASAKLARELENLP